MARACKISPEKTELSKVAALPPDALEHLNAIELVDCLAAFKRQMAADLPADFQCVFQHAQTLFSMQKSVVGDSMDKARVLLTKSHGEVEDIHKREEQCNMCARLWSDLVDIEKNKKDLASMTHDAFNSSVAEGQHEVGKILCALADKMDALVPGQSVSMLKEIKDFTESGL